VHTALSEYPCFNTLIMVQVVNPFIEHYCAHRTTGPVESSRRASRIEHIIALLNKRGLIDLKQLRALCFYGVPSDCRGLRALVWKLLLQYLPADVGLWSSTHQGYIQQYEGFRKEFSCRRFASFTESTLEAEVASGVLDADLFLWREIRKDIERTCPELQFFFLPSDLKPECESHSRLGLSPAEVLHNNSSDYSQSLVVTNGVERHADVMMRILYIYGQLNPGIRYVQGMNELLAPIYYLFAHDPNPRFAHSLEVDTFYCFSHLMSELKELFVRNLDETSLGINARLFHLHSLLHRLDPSLHTYLDYLGISPHFYALRWLTLLLTQDFHMPDILKLWDSLLADAKRFVFFDYVCVAMVVASREAIIGQDFGTALKELQRVGSKKVEDVLRLAVDLMAADYNSI